MKLILLASATVNGAWTGDYLSGISLFAMDALSTSLVVVLGMLVVAGLATGVIWLRHSFTVKAAQRELAAYKEQVVALSDKIDALLERHKLLPHLDKDFVTPMAGETLAAFNQVAAKLELHRQEWLKLMNVWEESQALLESEKFLGVRRASEARQKIGAAAAPARLEAVLSDCEAPLDRIERSHELVTSNRNSFEQQRQQLIDALAALSAVPLATTAYQPTREAAEGLVGQAQSFMPADPLAALRCLEDALAKLAELNRRGGKILEHVRAVRDAAKRIEEIAQAAAQRRSQGFLLREEGADPDPLLGGARQEHDKTWAAMNQADEPAAAAAVTKAAALAEQARTAIERHVAARSKCESDLMTLQTNAARVAGLQSLARGQHAELLRDFAAETWSTVADTFQNGQGRFGSAQRAAAEAAQHAAPHVQHYFLASKLLVTAAEEFKLAETALGAVGLKLRELVEQRAACQAQLGRARGLADCLAQLLHANTADRAKANETFRTAAAALERVTQESRSGRPNWIRLAAQVREIQADLEKAEKLAKEDLQLAQQAAMEIAKSEAAVREARAFNELGFTADVAGAETQLAQARGRLAAQEYEETIRIAKLAEQAAQSARVEAQARAQRRQRELEAQRQAEEAARAAAAASTLPAEADDPTVNRAREC